MSQSRYKQKYIQTILILRKKKEKLINKTKRKRKKIYGPGDTFKFKYKFVPVTAIEVKSTFFKQHKSILTGNRRSLTVILTLK